MMNGVHLILYTAAVGIVVVLTLMSNVSFAVAFPTYAISKA